MWTNKEQGRIVILAVGEWQGGVQDQITAGTNRASEDFGAC
jgi:hypothetical protein